MNGSYIQLQGPFKKNEDLVPIIKAQFGNSFKYIERIGVQSKSTNRININGQIFEIGKTEILEFNEVKITSLFFIQDELESTLIDCIVI